MSLLPRFWKAATRTWLAFLFLLTAPAAARAQGSSPTDFGWKNMEASGQRPLLVILIQQGPLPAGLHVFPAEIGREIGRAHV